MGFERYYQISIPSNQIIILSDRKKNKKKNETKTKIIQNFFEFRVEKFKDINKIKLFHSLLIILLQDGLNLGHRKNLLDFQDLF
jgi:hypothetical protein